MLPLPLMVGVMRQHSLQQTSRTHSFFIWAEKCEWWSH